MTTGPFRILFVSAADRALPGVQAAVGDHSGFDLTTVQTTRKGRAAVDWEPVDCVLLSVPLDDGPVEEFVDEIRSASPGVAIVLLVDARREGVALEAEPFETVPADESLLETLFEKLFQNVCDHAAATAVHVGPCYDSGTLTGFYVADDGTGFPESDEDLADLGVSFSGAGAGVGLAVTQDIVERHGWLMGASTAESGGARIDITTSLAAGDTEAVSTVEGE